MAQGTNGANRLGRELKDSRHAACKRGRNKLRCEHGKMSVDFPNEAARCQRFLSRRAQSSFVRGGKHGSRRHAVTEVGSPATGPPMFPIRNIQTERDVPRSLAHQSVREAAPLSLAQSSRRL